MSSPSENKTNVLAIFHEWDLNGNGTIDEAELRCVLTSVGVSEADVTSLLALADTNKDGHIDYNEFVEWFYSSAPSAVKSKAIDQAGFVAGAVGEFHIRVKMLNGEEVLTCTSLPEMTVLAVKLLVAEKTEIAVHKQTIIHDVSVLDNGTYVGLVAGPDQKGCIELTLQVRTSCFAGKYLVTLCNLHFRTAQYDQVCGHYVLELHGDTLHLKYSGYPDHIRDIKSHGYSGFKDLGQRAVAWEDEHTFTFFTQDFLGEIRMTFEEDEVGALGLKFREHDLAVTQITNGRPAANKGLIRGDLLRMVNTTDVSKMKVADLRPLLQQRPLQLCFKRWACPGLSIVTNTDWKHHDHEISGGLCNLHLCVRFHGDSPEDKASVEVLDSEGAITSWRGLTIKYLGPLEE